MSLLGPPRLHILLTLTAVTCFGIPSEMPFAASYCQDSKPPSESKENRRQDSPTVDELVDALNQTGKSPTTYIIDTFETHQIVLLGEIHEVRETCEFVASLIEPLDKAGVKRLCSEFLPSRLNDRLQKIITSGEYDEAAVVQLFRESAWPTWGYQEYMDIIQEVWRVNRSHDANAAPFMIVGMDSDWKQAELLGANAQTRFKTILDRENHMTEVIRETAGDDNKVLVHVGFAHTVRQGMRVAKQLDDAYGDRLFQVVMHHRLLNAQREAPITVAVEDAVRKSRFDQVGFDVSETSFGKLEDPRLPFARALGGDASLGALAEGLIFLQPVDQLHKVRWVDDFITAETFADALKIARSNRWIDDTDQPETPQALDELLKKRLSDKRADR